jgi:hypothetical protein
MNSFIGGAVHMKKTMSISLMIMVILGAMSTPFGQSADAANVSNYVDFNSKKWWSEYVKWGLDEGVINGYQEKDKSGKLIWEIKPNNPVTEAEFITMILRRMAEEDLESADSNNWWASASYDVAISYNLPTRSMKLSPTDDANSPITRGRTAKIVVKIATGELMTDREAINWLYSIGFEGTSKTERTYESYKPNDPLTRAEAITFIKRLYDKGYTSIVDGEESGVAPEVISID